MLRHVLCCVAPDVPGDGTRETAIQFAAGYGASVSGLFVRKPVPPPFPSMADPLVPSFPSAGVLKAYDEEVKAHEIAQDAAVQAATARFDESCRGADVIGRMFVRTGSPSEEIVAGSKTADLVVVGRGKREDSTLGSVSGWLVRHIARPVMLTGEPVSGFSRISVAYDGSPGAERALALAADIAANWKSQPVEVHLIHVHHHNEPQRAELALAERYLDIYGIRHFTHDVAGVAADVIVELARRTDADLLAMGAYGHSLLREVVLGSITQQVIAHWNRPLLVSR